MNNELDSRQIMDLKDFIPQKIQSGRFGHMFDLHREEREKYYYLYYFTNVANQTGKNVGIRKYEDKIIKKINRTLETFEVLGLLQGEMSKTYNKTIIFANCEPNINRKVMNWFSNELDIKHDDWHWYIKVNINRPEDANYQKQVEDKVINHWIKETKLNFEKKYPTTVSFIKDTVNKKLRETDYGTLLIEFKSNIISEVFKNFVKKITYEHIINCTFEEILFYMRGIIAAESTIHLNRISGHYRVYITSTKKEERLIFIKCLEKLGVEAKNYDCVDDVIISKKHNNFKLLELDLMSLNPTKYKKFQELISCYSDQTRNNFLVKELPILVYT